MSKSLSLIDNLAHNPQIFEFYQAIQLLEKLNTSSKPIRYLVSPSLGFSVSDICEIDFSNKIPIEVQVTFMGLIGQSGVLPDFFTELLMEQLHLKYEVLKDLLNLFNHSVIVLFFAAWKKYHDIDQFKKILQCIAGEIGSGLDNGGNVESCLLNYAGLFAQHQRTASNLENILSGYFNFPVVIKQFQPVWFNLGHDAPKMLGQNLALGNRYLCFHSKVRLVIGPLFYKQFNALLPGYSCRKMLTLLVRRYLGYVLNVDVELVLKKSEVPNLALDRHSKLGWNSWLKISESECDVSGMIFNLG